jgi:DNA-binding winged helix-turn-helix (wHTH) protein
MVFIKNLDEILSKEYLLKVVWDDFGLTPSNHNLYSSISELRKAIANLGVDEKLITTIPKVGFQFNATVEFSSVESNIESQVNLKKGKNTNKERIIGYLTTTILTVLSTFLLYYIFNIINQKKITFKNEVPEAIEKINKCSIYSLDKINLEKKQDVIKKINTKINARDKCMSIEFDTYYSGKSSTDDKFYLGGCAKKNNDQHIHCFNIRYN